MSEDTLLLTPFIAPPERELKKALLLSDRISTIASPAYRPTAALAELESRGWWVPAYLGELESSDRDAAIRECISSAKRYRPDEKDWRQSDRLLAGKLPYELESWLVRNDYLRNASEVDSWLQVSNRSLVPGLLAICGRRLCQAQGWQYSVSTTATAKQALLPLDEEGDRASVALKIYDIPEPHPDASFDDIVDFRQNNQNKLSRYAEGLRQVRSAVAKAHDREDLEAALHDYRARVAELHQTSGPLKNKQAGWRRNPTTLLIPLAEVGTAAADWIFAGPSFAPLVLAAQAVVSIVTLREHDATSYLSAGVAKKVLQPPAVRTSAGGFRD